MVERSLPGFEYSKALRVEIHELGDTLRGEMREQGEVLRVEMREQGEVLRVEMRELGDTLRGEIRGSEANLSTHMRVLHEAVLERIATIGEGGHQVRRQKPAAGTAGRRTRKSKP